jgi:hypothetical protein
MHMQFDSQDFSSKFDREPFAFSHDLHRLELFSQDRLLALARRFDSAPSDYFVTASAPSADTEFFKVSHGLCTPSQALARLQTASIRILLKRPENHEPEFRRLLDDLFAQVVDMRPELRSQRIMRLEAGLFITSAASTTPFHFDPEINFFSQIEGEKEYHVYAPASLHAPELERFYLQGQVSIGQVDLHGRDAAYERIYRLRPVRDSTSRKTLPTGCKRTHPAPSPMHLYMRPMKPACAAGHAPAIIICGVSVSNRRSLALIPRAMFSSPGP